MYFGDIIGRVRKSISGAEMVRIFDCKFNHAGFYSEHFFCRKPVLTARSHRSVILFVFWSTANAQLRTRRKRFEVLTILLEVNVVRVVVLLVSPPPHHRRNSIAGCLQRRDVSIDISVHSVSIDKKKVKTKKRRRQELNPRLLQQPFVNSRLSIDTPISLPTGGCTM